MQVNRKTLNLDGTLRQDFYFCSDIHFGNKGCDIKLFKKELKEAKKRDCRILIIGDLYDLIYSKDPRHNPSMLIPELQGRDDAVDKAIELLVKILNPYSTLIDGIGMGNHELAFIKYNNTDPTARTIRELNCGTETHICNLGYSGYMLYDLKTNNKIRTTFDILYHHGKGGESQVTKGMIDINRKQTSWIYDLYIFGHKHKTIAARDCRIMPHRGNTPETDWIESRPMKSSQVGGFQQNYPKDEEGKLPGYSEIKEHSPSPLGGVFGHVDLIRTNGHYTIKTVVEI